MNFYKKIIAILVLSAFAVMMCTYGQGVRESLDEALQFVPNTQKYAQKLESKNFEKNIKSPVVFSTGFPFSNTQKDVLVIPSSETGSEKLVEIMEDISVMSRIIDKQIPERTGWMFKNTSSVFLEGYGALFVINVDFPLLPIEENQAEEVEETDVDPLWEQTKKELDSPSFPGIVIPHPMPHGGYNSDKAIKFDGEKVEAFKRNLIESLKHATNIRALNDDDMVIITVTGTGQGFGGAAQQSIVIKSGGNSVITQSSPGRLAASSSGVLTIRAKKSDINAFSKGELNIEQFSSKVTVLAY